jgi:hypothetical protein
MKIKITAIIIFFSIYASLVSGENQTSGIGADKKTAQSSGSSGTNSEDIVVDPPYYIETFEMQEKKNIHINTFYYVNHFFLHVLTNFGILDSLNNEDVEYIVGETLKGLSSGEPVNFIYNRFSGEKKLAISLSIVAKDKNNYLLLLTNYDSKKQDVLPLDTPKEKRQDCFTSIYYIAPDKLVNENHFYSKEVENELKKSGNLLNLADFYIFDEKPDNDVLIEEILTKAYANQKKPEDKFQAAILFSLYYMMIDKPDLALSALENARTLLDKNIKTNKKNLNDALKIQLQEIELINRLNDPGLQ